MPYESAIWNPRSSIRFLHKLSAWECRLRRSASSGPRSRPGYRGDAGNADEISSRSLRHPLVPTLRVGMPSSTLRVVGKTGKLFHQRSPRGNAVPDAPRPDESPAAIQARATQSVEEGIPTRSVGTRSTVLRLTRYSTIPIIARRAVDRQWVTPRTRPPSCGARRSVSRKKVGTVRSYTDFTRIDWFSPE
jgi:hypothetical protein